ncbi:hypothetical protein [Lepagella muris]|uniref:hypothetical protein n=1 Tax=Lepagella muris TaxID=3032870 RepID=UPI0014417262|nr:hypothetical protein [Lepagella muris]
MDADLLVEGDGADTADFSGTEVGGLLYGELDDGVVGRVGGGDDAVGGLGASGE